MTRHFTHEIGNIIIYLSQPTNDNYINNAKIHCIIKGRVRVGALKMMISESKYKNKNR